MEEQIPVWRLILQPNHRTSSIVKRILDECTEHSITVRRFTALLGEGSFALSILLFSLPSVVAGAIPGFSTLTGVPILIIALQMAAGRASIWLPERVAQKEFSPDSFKKALLKSLDILVLMEKFLKPRLLVLTSPVIERFLALIIALLAAVLSMPIPGGNFLPSIGISILALAMLERDGVLLLVGLVFIASSATFIYDVLVKVANWLF